MPTQCPSHQPAPVLFGTRLRLRNPHPSDAAALLAMHANQEVMRYWSTPPWTSLTQAHDWLERAWQGAQTGQSYSWVISSREAPDTLLGTCALFAIQPGCRRAEVGYGLARPHWGHGYATEAMQAVVTHAFGAMDLRRLEADIDPDNHASQRVLERLGFVEEGYLRERWEVDGIVSDSRLFGLLRREWRAGSQPT
ncbi:GNAT family N-acetyltransferase [Oleiagrimonas sp. C23AA]|uniref:GNAT family N-acetyltransferase n=1 Tax=Oleiagrimonas sp. C23AA TaxID=2719047 RepID=UPI0014238F0F|nr:GNAT family N-acetyltransferase [Oleiagrimonas sp. C23AA]NII11963.1 GNAT family N-acetyltransferase [Oleiagrimonas sp. C23AA]